MSEYELQICDNCYAFGPNVSDVLSENDGACRLYPPHNIALSGGNYASVFPSVNREDWCRQWREKVVKE